MRSGLLSLVLATIVLGFVVGLYTRVTFPTLWRSTSQPGVASANSQVSAPVPRPWRGLRPSADETFYGQPILLVALVATVAAIVAGFWSRNEGDYGTRPAANIVITLAVVALMLLAIEMLVSLLIPVLV
jgi:hypothetical protein